MADTRLQQLAKTDRNPVQETEYQNLLRQQRDTQRISQPSTGSTTDVVSMARELAKVAQEIGRPAISRLEAQREPIQQRFAQREQTLAGRREPLKQRYENLLNELTRKEQVETGETQRTVSREFGRRGIPLQSTQFSDVLAEKLRPTREFFTGQRAAAETGLTEAQQGLAELINQVRFAGGESLTGLQQAIANIEAARAPEAVSGALSLFSTQQAAREAQLNRALQQARLEEDIRAGKVSEELAKRKFEEVTKPTAGFTSLGEGSTLFNLLTGQKVYKAPKTYKPEAKKTGTSQYYTPSGTGRYSLIS